MPEFMKKYFIIGFVTLLLVSFVFLPVIKIVEKNYYIENDIVTSRSWAYGTWQESFFNKEKSDPYDLFLERDVSGIINIKILDEKNSLITEKLCEGSFRSDGKYVYSIRNIQNLSKNTNLTLICEKNDLIIDRVELKLNIITMRRSLFFYYTSGV